MAHSSWGSGYPHCQYSRINHNFAVDTKWGKVRFPGGVRRELEELITRLVKETANRGYRFGTKEDPSYGCWGFACRSIRGTSKTPSNHSFGTAIDINAPRNPMSTKLKTDMPEWMPNLWNAYGFRWGGDYKSRPDAMHYEFMGSLDDVVRLTQVARSKRLGEKRTSTPAPADETFPGVVRMGSVGEHVKKWQRMFNANRYGLKVDGHFGSKTNHVVRHFQEKSGLTVDGVAGRKTWAKLVD